MLTAPEVSAEAPAIEHELQETMAKVLRTLTYRERSVIEMRFGLDGGEPKTLREVADEFRITKDRVRQLEARALDQLRSPRRSLKLASFLD